MSFIPNKKQIDTFLICCIILLLSACAQVVPLTGGVKDITPPRIVKYVPDSAALNFKEKEIRIFFNEYIQLKELTDQFIISPYLKYTPDVSLQKNKIIRILITDTLKPNTTYTMSFGNAVIDLNENNILKDFRYVFSTGASLDTIQLSGKVQDAFNLKTEKDVWVMLYDNLNDSVVYKSKPLYYTKANEDGSFAIYNIRAGTYRVIALKDENKNLQYNPTAEYIGITGKSLNLKESSTENLYLFKEPTEKQLVIKKNSVGYGHLFFVFNKPVKKLQLNYIKGSKPDKEVFIYTTAKDTLDYWFSQQAADSISLQISDNDQVLDTLLAKTVPKEARTERNKGVKLALTAFSSLQAKEVLDVGNDVIIYFNHPLTQLDKSKIIVEENKKNYTDFKIVWDSLSPKLVIKNTRMDEEVKKVLWKEGSTFNLTLLPKAATDIFNLQSDSVKIKFKIPELKNYGAIKLQLQLPEEGQHYVLQLLDEKETIVLRSASVNKSQLFDFEYLYPQNYRIKLIYDANNNGQWDTGNYLSNKLPEQVIYFPEPVTVKENWDNELIWKLK